MRLLLAIAAAFVVLAAPASAHVQVRPALAAPGDPVLFEVIVPGESDAKTVEVTLQVPKDVIPFSFNDPPGWERENREASDGSLEAIVWRGEQPSDGFSRFGFLASTPEKEGEIVWKALQRYDDGEIARWIGAPDSDNPAPVTTVSASAPRQNAGGEGAQATGEGEGAATPTPAAPAGAPAAEDDDSPLPLILGIVAVVISLVALALALRPRRAMPAD